MKLILFLFLPVLLLAQAGQLSPPQVRMTGNIGPGGIFPLFNSGTINLPADADYTMSFPDMSGTIIRLTSAVPLTQTRNIIAPSDRLGYEFTFQNATTGDQGITVKGTSGTGVIIPNGQVMTVIFDGTNYVAGSSGAGGGGGTWTIVNNVNTSTVPANVHDMFSVGSPAPLSILASATGAIGGTCGSNTLAATTGQWAIACNAANEVVIPNTVDVPALKVNGAPVGNVWSASDTYSMSSTLGATVYTAAMVTPAADSNYYLTWQLQQIDTGSGGSCNAGALGVNLQFTEAVSNAPINAYISGRAFNAPGGTNSFSAGTTVDATNYFVGFPFEFTAKGGTAVTFTLTQTTASNCATGQNFILRAHLKAW